MKTKYPSLFGILAVLMLVASFVVPVNLAKPSAVQADPGICKWDTLREPGNLTGTEVIDTCTDPISYAVASDFNTIYAVIKTATTSPYGGLNVLKISGTKGLFWGASPWTALLRQTPQFVLGDQVFQVVVAPDDPKFIAVVTSFGGGGGAIATGPREVWVSTNGGAKWNFTNLNAALLPGEVVRSLDISVDYGGTRDLAVGTATGGGGGRVLVIKSSGFSGWKDQLVTAASVPAPVPTVNLGAVDVFAVKFSPSYASDASLVVVFADVALSGQAPCALSGSTWYNVALRDIDKNLILQWAFPEAPVSATNNPGIEVRDPTWAAGSSPNAGELNTVSVQLPSDFSGQAASLRRAYISLDAMNTTAGCPTNKADCARDGIFRIDDTTQYTLMDTHTQPTKSIYSISYFGTYASGKLLAGERNGYPCTATVPTWFTDSPTTCPVPCWYPCLKCPTGAACQANCLGQCGVGAAQVQWAPQGNLAYVLTSAAALRSVANATAVGQLWWHNLFFLASVPFGVAPICNDESALAISRNNGETWNEISLIDTTITKFTDVAPTPDCKTIYLASVNACSATACAVVFTANVSGGATVTPSIVLTSATLSGCTPGTTIVSTSNSTTGPTYNASNCTITYSLCYSATIHCGCSTCGSCTVNAGPVCSPAIGTATLVTNNGTFTSTLVTIVVPFDCSSQPGCVVQSGCCCFDSVWRTSFNPDVTSPLTPQPVGTYWERVFTHVTAPDCTQTQTDLALLRVVPYCADPTGEIVGWAVFDPLQTFRNGVAAWSPDFGDYWAMLTPRNPVQDFTFESRTVLYFLSPTGLVQKMPYTGTAWSSALADVDSYLPTAHSIAAYPEGKVLVGAGTLFNQTYFATSYCGNFNTDSPTFALQALSGNTGGGNVHVAFDPAFKDNNTYFIGVDSSAGVGTGSVYRNNPAAQLRWTDTNMMDPLNGAVGCNAPQAIGQFGIVLGFTGSSLYSAHASAGSTELKNFIPCGVNRTIDDGTGRYGPLSGMPKPGIAWDNLDAGFPTGNVPCFTLEPTSLKICGCCTLDTDSTLYAIDNANYNPVTQEGLIWAFTDCMAKRGPALITEDKTLIGCDPVSGRAQEVNLCWEQLCVANHYDLEIAKDANFTLLIINFVDEDDCPVEENEVQDVTAPCVFFPAGGLASNEFDNSAIALFGNLECGHTYYWRVKVRQCATTQIIRSPWSEARSFTVKAGLPVVSPYLGLQLLAPNNGCLGCPVSPVSFSWSPFKETTKYKFDLAKDAAMTQIVKEDETTTTAYEYSGTLDYSTNYFWRVMSEEPAPSDWSATFSFQTEAKPTPPAQPAGPAPTPVWVWVVIAIGAILVIVTLILIFKTRRV